MSNDLQIQILTHAKALIETRGWGYKYSCGPGSPMNIRSAVSAATTQLVSVDSQWHCEYLAAINALAATLQEGIQSWEFGTRADKPRKRTQAEVLQLFTYTIDRLERDAKTDDLWDRLQHSSTRAV